MTWEAFGMDNKTHMNANSMPSRDPMASGVVNLSGMLRRVCPRYPIATGVSVEILMTPELICVKENAGITPQILAIFVKTRLIYLRGLQQRQSPPPYVFP